MKKMSYIFIFFIYTFYIYSSTSNTLFPIWDKNNKSGFMDSAGKVMIGFVYDSAKDFHEGLAAVEANDKYGYIDYSGKIIIKPQYDEVSFFSEGLAAVKIIDKWGFIDSSGKMIIKPQFDNVGNFEEGLACFMEKKFIVGYKYGFIDKTGKKLSIHNLIFRLYLKKSWRVSVKIINLDI